MKIIGSIKNRLIKIDIKGRLVAGFAVATILSGVIAASIGISTSDKIILEEVQSRVRQGISTAKLIYKNNLDWIASRIQYSVESYALREFIEKPDHHTMKSLRELLRNTAGPQASIDPHWDHSGLDMLTLVDNQGVVLYRVGNPEKKETISYGIPSSGNV